MRNQKSAFGLKGWLTTLLFQRWPKTGPRTGQSPYYMIEAFLEIQHLINLSFMEIHSTQDCFLKTGCGKSTGSTYVKKTLKENDVIPDLPELVKMQKIPFPAHMKDSGFNNLLLIGSAYYESIINYGGPLAYSWNPD